MKSTKRLIGLLLAATLLFGAAGCQTSNGDAGDVPPPPAADNAQEAVNDSEPAGEAPTEAGEAVTVRLGVVGENNDHWQPVVEALAQENVTLEMVKFADYILPNQALADGDIDMNAFQHYAFLNNEISDKGLELTVIGDSIIAPLGLYSVNVASIDEIGDGDKIAIPNDATNGGRSLKVLEAAGLITVDPEAGYVPEIKDITDNPLNLDFIEVEAAQTPSLLPDVAAAIINGQHAADAGLNTDDDAIYVETVQEGSDNPYINIIVVRTQDKDNELYLHIVDLFQSDEVEQVINELYSGVYIPAWK